MVSGLKLLGKDKKISGVDLLTPQTESSYTFEPYDKAKPYMSYVSEAEKKYELPNNLLANVIHTESRYDPEAKSSAGAVGIAQIMPKYHPNVDPTDPKASIDYSASYLRKLKDRFGSWDEAIAAYNTGPGNLKKYGMDNLPEETVGYLKKIRGAQTRSDSKPKSGIELLSPEQAAPVAPVESEDKPNVFDKDIYSGHLTGNIMANKFNLQRGEIGWNDETLHTATKNALIDVAKTQGMNVVATGELAMNLASSMLLYLPSKATGVAHLYQGIEIAKAAEEATARLGYQPFTEKGQQAAEMIGKGFEIYLTPARKIGEEVSKLSPELGYLVEFGAELAEFAVTGGVAKGVKAKFKPKIAEARKIIEAKHKMEKEALDQQMGEVEGIPDALMREAQKKVLEAEQVQADLRYKETVAKFEKGLSPLVAEELGRKGEEIARIKSMPIKGSGLKGRPIKTNPVEINKFADRLIAGEKLVTSEDIQFYQNNSKVLEEILAEKTKVADSGLKEPKIAYGKVEEIAKVKEEPKTIKSFKELDEPTTELDLQTGTPEPKKSAEVIQLHGDAEIIQLDKTIKKRELRLVKDAKTIKQEVDYRTVKPEMQELFDILDMPKQSRIKLKRKRNIKVIEQNVMPGEEVSIPNTWHDAVFRYTAFRDTEGNLHSGRAGSYDSILSEGQVAGAKKSTLQPGTTVYVFDTGGSGTVAETNTVRIYRVAPEQGKIENIKSVPVIEEHITELDLQTGTPEPIELKGDSSPFREKNKKYTADMRNVYAKNDHIAEDPNLILAKSLNDVNSWLDGENVDIGIARENLSKLAVDSRESSNQLAMLQYFNSDRAQADSFITAISEAAAWARGVEKPKGTKLYDITGAVGKGAKKLTETVKDAGKFVDEFRRSTKEKDLDFKYAAKQLKADTVRAFFDQSETLLKYVRKHFPKESQQIIDRQRSAAAGKGYGSMLYDQAVKEIFRGKSTSQIEAINTYVLARRFKDIYSYRSEKTYKHQPGYGPKQSAGLSAIVEMIKDTPSGAWKMLNKKVPELKKLFGDMGPEEMKEVVRSGEALFEWSRKIVDDLVDAGIKSPEEGVLLKAHDYRKFKSMTVESLYDFSYDLKMKGQSIKSTSSGVESLGWGSTKMIEPDARIVLHEQFGRAYGAIANQAAKLKWKELAEKYPDNGFVSVKKVKGWSAMPYLKDGKRSDFYFHPDAVKYLVTQSKDISPRLSMIIRGATFAPITRTLAVGGSPIWATFIGLPMDVMHSLWTAKVWEAGAGKTVPTLSYPFYKTRKGNYKKVYNQYIPGIDKLQLGTDMGRVFRDVYSRGPLTQNLMKHGLVMNFLTQRQSRYLKGTKPPGDFAKAMDLLSYHGLSMELWPRIATADRIIRSRAKQKGLTYEKALKDKDIMYEAAHSARDRMDYNQGGWLVKALDQSGIIFLNGGVLGTRTFWREATSNPVNFAFRTARISATAAGITAAAWSLYESNMKDIPTKGNEKNAIFPLFPNWIKAKDIDGNDVSFYVKLRMDPGAAFMYKLSENLTKTYMFDQGLIKTEPNYHEVVDSLKKIGPVDLSLHPHIQLWVDYTTNYSWWKDRQMYTKLGGKTLSFPDSQHEGEFDRNVPQVAKDIGKVTKLSPKRLSGAGSNVIPYNNEFVWMMGKFYEKAFSDVPEEARNKHWLITLAETPGFNRIIGIARSGKGRRDIMDEVNDDIELKRIVRNGKFNMLATDYAWYGARERKGVLDYMYSFKDKKVYDSFKDSLRFIESPAIKALPHRNFWLSFSHKSLEGKARTWIKLLESADDKERKQLWKEYGIVSRAKGIISPEFRSEVRKQFSKDD